MRLTPFILFFFYSCSVSSLEIKCWKTDQGSMVMYYNTPEIPMADIRLAFSAEVRETEKNTVYQDGE